MEIRTITLFDEFTGSIPEKRLATLGETGAAVCQSLREEGYTVQTVRLALGSVPSLAGGDPARVVPLAREIEASCRTVGIDYVSIGLVCPLDPPEFFEALADALAATGAVFASGLITDADRAVRVGAARRAAHVIRRLSEETEGGFGNLRFAALANVSAGVPFLPGAFHDGGPPALAIGLEAATLAVEACGASATLEEATSRLVALVESHGERIGRAVARARPPDIRFRGIDVSLAPYPEPARSVGTAIERLSGVRIGEHGTLAATAVLTRAIRSAAVARVGYSGAFLPVFEDAVLAARAAERLYSINDLLLWSSVCGTGLDTVPLPGSVSEATLAAILVDMAALALRLDKPLTARLMPIPGKAAGDPVAFDFPYFAPTRVLETKGDGLGGLLAGADVIPLGT